jgi:hypothetical protein
MEPREVDGFIDLRTKYHCVLEGDALDDALSTAIFRIGFFQMLSAARGMDDELVQGAWKNLVQSIYALAGIDIP